MEQGRGLGWEGRMSVGGGDFQKAEFTGCVGEGGEDGRERNLSSTVGRCLTYQK